MFSIYHFFRDLAGKKSHFLADGIKLEQFPFNSGMLSCRNNSGIFPDLGIRLSGKPHPFTGGELIELKDRQADYTIPSFNSTIPLGMKSIASVIGGKDGVIASQMREAGDDIDSLSIRQVYYLLRGKKSGGKKRRSTCKVCLVHGSFFETVSVEKLVTDSLGQILDEAARADGEEIPADARSHIIRILSKPEYFRRTRTVDNAAVTIRFRVMTETQKECNILNSQRYPRIGDDTINLIAPFHSDKERAVIVDAVNKVFGKDAGTLRVFDIKHPFNGPFIVFQISLL